MGNSTEVGVSDYMRLMKDYLVGRIDVGQYTSGYFELTKKRRDIADEMVIRITQQAYADADDYEPDPALRVKDPRWIGESELRERVGKSLRELESLGHSMDMA